MTSIFLRVALQPLRSTAMWKRHKMNQFAVSDSRPSLGAFRSARAKGSPPLHGEFTCLAVISAPCGFNGRSAIDGPRYFS